MKKQKRTMWKQLKSHFSDKRKEQGSFKTIRAESTFVIHIQDGIHRHKFTIKITPECNIHTQFMVQSNVSKEVRDFILRFNLDLVDNVYIPLRDRYVMLVLNNEVRWIGFSPFHPLTLSLYQAEKLVQQLYELKYEHFQKNSKRTYLTFEDKQTLNNH
jgi:hypothetical protein